MSGARNSGGVSDQGLARGGAPTLIPAAPYRRNWLAVMASPALVAIYTFCWVGSRPAALLRLEDVSAPAPCMYQSAREYPPGHLKHGAGLDFRLVLIARPLTQVYERDSGLGPT